MRRLAVVAIAAMVAASAGVPMIIARAQGIQFNRQGGNYDLLNVASLRRQWVYWCELPGGGATTTMAPCLVGAAINSGTVAVSGTADRPGIYTISSSGSADSGSVIWTAMTNGLLLRGGEYLEVGFQPNDIVGVTNRIGFHDSLSAAAIVDGVHFTTGATGLISGVCSAASATTATGTNFQLVDETWYRLVISINAAGTLATFEVRSEGGSTLHWTDTCASNIPTTTGQELGVSATITGTAGARAMSSFDYIYARGPSVLAR